MLLRLLASLPTPFSTRLASRFSLSLNDRGRESLKDLRIMAYSIMLLRPLVPFPYLPPNEHTPRPCNPYLDTFFAPSNKILFVAKTRRDIEGEPCLPPSALSFLLLVHRVPISITLLVLPTDCVTPFSIFSFAPGN